MHPSKGEASRSRELAMLSVDAEAFSQALLDIWPDIRFTNFDRGYETIEHEDGYLFDRPKKI